MIASGVEAASQDMQWKAIDRYSKDYIELQTKDNVKFYKTPDAILKRSSRSSTKSPRRRRARTDLQEDRGIPACIAKRAAQWEQDTVVSRKMVFDHYFGPNAKKPI